MTDSPQVDDSLLSQRTSWSGAALCLGIINKQKPRINRICPIEGLYVGLRRGYVAITSFICCIWCMQQGERTLIQTEYVNLMRYVGQRMDALMLCE
jgi:hypothetical protein